MAGDFVYPENAVLERIAQDYLPQVAAMRKIFQIMPIRNVNASKVEWEQMDNFIGLMQPRGYNGQPPRVQRVGIKRYSNEPGVYGEYLSVDEREMTVRREMGEWAQPINLNQIVTDLQTQLLQRYLDRLEAVGWTLLATSTFSVLGDGGQILHTDTYTGQTFTSSVAWSTPGTSTPLADLRAIKLLHRGHGVTFDRTASMYMNQSTMNQMLANTNTADLYGRRVEGFATINSADQANELLTRDDLPNIVIHDNGYFDNSGSFQLFIPTGTAVLVGRRVDGAPVGEFQLTSNSNNAGNAPGPYTKVIDTMDREVPRQIHVHAGFNGGPAMKYPSAIVAATFN